MRAIACPAVTAAIRRMCCCGFPSKFAGKNTASTFWGRDLQNCSRRRDQSEGREAREHSPREHRRNTHNTSASQNSQMTFDMMRKKKKRREEQRSRIILTCQTLRERIISRETPPRKKKRLEVKSNTIVNDRRAKLFVADDQ